MSEVLTGPKIFTPEYYQRMRELENASWWNCAMREAALILMRDLQLRERGIMLDVGCGSGQSMAWFKHQHPGWRTIGFDIASEGLAAARSFGLTSVIRASALDLPVRSQSVDLVVTLDVLQHLPLEGGDSRALREMARVLRPGGHLFLRTNAQSIPRTPDDPRYQFRKYEEAQLRARLGEASFEIVRLSRLNAVLGLAEIPREWKAQKQPDSYHGILASTRAEPVWQAAVKRAWLRVEARAVSRGWRLPFGRTMIALCRRRDTTP